MAQRPHYYKMIGGKRFTLMGVSCLKNEALKSAALNRKMGFTSRVVFNNKRGYLVYNGELKHPEKMTWRNR